MTESLSVPALLRLDVSLLKYPLSLTHQEVVQSGHGSLGTSACPCHKHPHVSHRVRKQSSSSAFSIRVSISDADSSACRYRQCSRRKLTQRWETPCITGLSSGCFCLLCSGLCCGLDSPPTLKFEQPAHSHAIATAEEDAIAMPRPLRTAPLLCARKHRQWLQMPYAAPSSAQMQSVLG